MTDINLEERQVSKQIQFHEHNLREYLHGLSGQLCVLGGTNLKTESGVNVQHINIA